MPVWIVQTGIYCFILLRDNISFVFSWHYKIFCVNGKYGIQV